MAMFYDPANIQQFDIRNVEAGRQAKMQNELGKMQLGEARQGIERGNQLGALFERGGMPSVESVAAVDPDFAIKYGNMRAKQSTAEQEADDERIAQLNRGLQYVLEGTIGTPDDRYANVRKALERVEPNSTSRMPDAFDAAWVSRTLAMTGEMQKAKAPLSPAGKLADDLKRGLITQKQYDAARKKTDEKAPTLQTYTDEQGQQRQGYFIKQKDGTWKIKPVGGVKLTPQEKFLQILEGPDQPSGGTGADILGGAGGDIVGQAAGDIITGDETQSESPSIREMFFALPDEVQAGIKLAKDPMAALSKYMLRQTGLDIQFDENGKLLRITQGGKGAEWGKKGRGTIEEKLFNAREGLARIQTIEDSYRPEFQQIGTRFQAAWAAGKEFLGFDLDSEDKALVADYAAYKRNAIENINRYIKEITGAQMSEAEATRLRRGVPDPGDSWYSGDSPTEFDSKLKSQARQLRAAAARYQYALKNGWDMNPDNLEKALPLDSVEDMIEERGAALERQLRARRPDLSDTAVEGFVMQTLNVEFGTGQ
ncbi:hypothetical protein LCGC14_0355150 [marine sediment metagenome]|uniref:Uncharacterized protein n=1 Tax=marine sediment metagenome TaxID=412755 RepID=A0A0F9T9Q6_9ZZZZ